MKENFKIAVTISSRTVFKWGFVFVLVNIITLITFLIALYGNIELADGGHVSIISIFIGLLTTNFFCLFINFWSSFFSCSIFLQ